LAGEIKTPPFSTAARLEAGILLRRLQEGESIGLPQSRSMAVIDANCHELRIQDRAATWRVVYGLERDAVVILEVFSKKSRATPKRVIDAARRRLREYRATVEE
jgi:phage-related protein